MIRYLEQQEHHSPLGSVVERVTSNDKVVSLILAVGKIPCPVPPDGGVSSFLLLWLALDEESVTERVIENVTGRVMVKLWGLSCAVFRVL
jgi:hypothetical protein